MSKLDTSLWLRDAKKAGIKVDKETINKSGYQLVKSPAMQFTVNQMDKRIIDSLINGDIDKLEHNRMKSDLFHELLKELEELYISHETKTKTKTSK